MAEKPSQATVQTVVFDTDILIWYLRGNDKARRFMELVPHQQRALSSLTFMELLQGCRNQEESRQIKVFISENISFVIHPDETTSRRAIALLEQHALPHGLRVVDALIAATALETGSSPATAHVEDHPPNSRFQLLHF